MADRMVEHRGDLIRVSPECEVWTDIDRDAAIELYRQLDAALFCARCRGPFSVRNAPESPVCEHCAIDMMAEPQKCPSCGGPPIGETDPNDLIHKLEGWACQELWQCRCECGLTGPTCKSREGAIAQWNMIRMGPPTELARDQTLHHCGCVLGNRWVSVKHCGGHGFPDPQPAKIAGGS